MYPLPLPLPMWSAAASLLVTGRPAAASLAVWLAGSCGGCVSASRGMRLLDDSIDPWAGAVGVGPADADARAAMPLSMWRALCCLLFD